MAPSPGRASWGVPERVTKVFPSCPEVGISHRARGAPWRGRLSPILRSPSPREHPPAQAHTASLSSRLGSQPAAGPGRLFPAPCCPGPPCWPNSPSPPCLPSLSTPPPPTFAQSASPVCAPGEPGRPSASLLRAGLAPPPGCATVPRRCPSLSSGSSYPESPPVEQQAAQGQQDQDDAAPRRQRADERLTRLGCGGRLRACVCQRNGVKMGVGRGRPLRSSSSFLPCRAPLRPGAPGAPGAPLALQLPEGERTAPGVAAGKPWLSREGGGTAEAFRAQ